MYWLFMGSALATGEIIWTRYPQGFPVKEAAEDFAKSMASRFDKVEVRFEDPSSPAPEPIGLNDEDLPHGPTEG